VISSWEVPILFQAVLFDLDGTLLDLDVDALMRPYMELLGRVMAQYIEPAQFQRVLMASVMAMINDEDPRVTNEEAFWREFERLVPVKKADLATDIDRFYRESFPTLRSVAQQVPAAGQVVMAVKERVQHVVLATNPIFPYTAIEERVRWAGIDPSVFSLITSYESMHACKPSPGYYREICALLGVEPHEALMVGNDPDLDMAPAASIGMSTYLVEDVTRPGKMEAQFAATSEAEPTGERAAPEAKHDARHRRGPLIDVLKMLS